MDIDFDEYVQIFNAVGYDVTTDQIKLITLVPDMFNMIDDASLQMGLLASLLHNVKDLKPEEARDCLIEMTETMVDF